MKNSTAAVFIACILGVVLIILCVCGMWGMLVADTNDLEWKPVPGTTTYEWR